MSGIEVAGIALAVFPIAVDGLKHFVQGVQTIKYWRRYRIKLQDYAGMMETHKTYYLDTLEELLTGIVESEDEMQELMAHPGGPTWRRPEYEENLKHRLGRSYQVYLRTLKTMTDSLTTMCEKLGVDTSGKVLWDEYSMVEREMKRIKVTLSKNIYRELLDVIDRANKDIRDITHQNIYLEPIRKKRQSQHPLAELRLIRKHAASLYQVFIAGKAWKCSCKAHHMASLRLEPRPQTLEVPRVDSAIHFRFRILLSTQGVDSCPLSTSSWQEIEVAPSLEKKLSAIISTESSASTKGVRWAPDPTTVSTMTSHISSTGHDCESIADICAVLCASKGLKEAMGFLVDEEDDKHKHYIYRANSTSGFEPRSKSLGELLSSSQKESPNVSLLRSERLHIAVTLASSVLQLNGTSWLNSQWTSSDIFFHSKKKPASSPSYLYPYLPWKLCVADTDAGCSLDPLNIEHFMVRSQVLLALGLTLVELCFGRTLAEMQRPEDKDPNEATTKFKTAHRLLNSVYSEMGISYGDVVRRCLYQLFDVRDMSLDNEDLQQKVFDEVVTPLFEDLNNFNGKSRIP